MKAKKLKWFQQDNQLFIVLDMPVDKPITFPVHEKLINYLAANVPSFIFLKVIMNNNTKYDFLLNFNKLKPLTSTQNKLKITIGAGNEDESKYQNTAEGSYYFYRGDSYADKYLTDTGWSTDQKAFLLINKEELSSAYRIHPPKKKDANKSNTEKIENNQPTNWLDFF